MKQKDIIVIIAVAIFAGIISVVASKVLFVKDGNKQQQVEHVDALSTTFTLPDNSYFNANAVDPTQTIQIGSSTNATPFSGTSN